MGLLLLLQFCTPSLAELTSKIANNTAFEAFLEIINFAAFEIKFLSNNIKTTCIKYLVKRDVVCGRATPNF